MINLNINHYLISFISTILVLGLFNNFFNNSNQSADLILEVYINEKKLAIITNADGTVAKYKVEVYVSFNLIDEETKEN